MGATSIILNSQFAVSDYIYTYNRLRSQVDVSIAIEGTLGSQFMTKIWGTGPLNSQYEVGIHAEQAQKAQLDTIINTGKILFGIGIITVDGYQLGELQNAKVSFTADTKLIYKRSITPYTDYVQYPSDMIVTNRNITISAQYARIGMLNLLKILGGTVSDYDADVNNRLTLLRNADLPEVEIYLKSPTDGSDVEVYLPRAKSTGVLEFQMVGDNFVVLDPSFNALYDESDNMICRITENNVSTVC